MRKIKIVIILIFILLMIIIIGKSISITNLKANVSIINGDNTILSNKITLLKSKIDSSDESKVVKIIKRANDDISDLREQKEYVNSKLAETINLKQCYKEQLEAMLEGNLIIKCNLDINQ